jgi:phage major head subunit gpT-like protein
MAYEIKDIIELNEIVETRWQLDFAKYMASSQKLTDRLTTEIPIKQRGANIAFTETWDGLDEIGLHQNPQYVDFMAQTFNREIKRFAKGVSLSLVDYEDPTAQAFFMKRLDGLAQEAAFLVNRQIAWALKNGESSTLAYDDQYLFSNSHTIQEQTFDNLLTGELNEDNFVIGETLLRTVPLGPIYDGAPTYLPTDLGRITLFIPPQLKYQAKKLLRNQDYVRADYNAENPFSGEADYFVSSLLTDANDWYMIMDLPGITPFVTLRHTKSKDSLTIRTDDKETNVIENQRYLYNASIMKATYPVHYWQMVKFSNS